MNAQVVRRAQAALAKFDSTTEPHKMTLPWATQRQLAADVLTLAEQLATAEATLAPYLSIAGKSSYRPRTFCCADPADCSEFC